MKVKYQFEFMDLDDGMVAVPVGKSAEQFKGVLKVNETARAILKLLETDTSEARVVDELMKEYSGDKAQIAGYVHTYIEKLIAEGIVE